MGGSKRPDRWRWLDAGLHPTRRDGAIAAVLFLLPWVGALALVSRHHPDVAATISILAALSVGLPTLWVTWAAYRGPRLSGTPAHDRQVGDTGGSRPVLETPPGEDALPFWVSQEADVDVKLGRLPREGVRGRDDDLNWLRHQLRAGGLVVLVGTGGMGKSTVAREFARGLPVAFASQHVWEVSGATPRGGNLSPSDLRSGGPRHRDSGGSSASLIGGLIGVARRLHGTWEDLQVIATQAPAGPGRLWRLLNRSRKGWLLIIDDADDPEVLAAPALPGAERIPSVTDGNGWIRASRRGLVLVTSRQRDPACWPAQAIVHEVKQLRDSEAAKILRDLAPGAGDWTEAEALANRLGGLPLVLRLVGRYLSFTEAEDASFQAYRQDLDEDLAHAMGHLAPGPDSPDATDERAIVTRTWELSGVPLKAWTL